jgi:glc operon protein GlcG
MAMALALLILVGTGQAQVVDNKALTLEGAKQIIAATAAEAQKKGAPGGTVAVVDDGGHLIALERLNNTCTASANIAIGKARTAVMFKQPGFLRR